MYEYRTMTPEQQKAIVDQRRRRGLPLHRPPHFEAPGEFRLISAACFEHQKFLSSLERLLWFEKNLLDMLEEMTFPCAAWCVLPNHYHALVQIADIKVFSKAIGQLHGRTSHELNRQGGSRGRKVWCNYQDRCMRSEAHFFTSLNYIHNNPVKHGYVVKWQEWPCSSVHEYLETKGREWLLDLWLNHPVLDFGKGWDDDLIQ